MKKFLVLGLLAALLLLVIFTSYRKNEQKQTSSMELTSRAFENGGLIPQKYTCDEDNINPPLLISGVPAEAKSLVLIMDDPDIPESVKQPRGIEVFDHWVVFNLPPQTTTIEEGREPKGVLGNNSAGRLGYTGPCPPDREHRYFFNLYALNGELPLIEGATKTEVERAMEGKIIAETQLMGRYNRVH